MMQNKPYPISTAYREETIFQYFDQIETTGTILGTFRYMLVVSSFIMATAIGLMILFLYVLFTMPFT